MANIFIAYSSEDMGKVFDFSNRLQEADHKVFVAAYSIEGGERFRDVIQEKLKSSNFFVPLISDDFIASEEAKMELDYAVQLAIEKRLKVLPVLINNIINRDLPLYVEVTQYIKYQSSVESQVKQLLLELSSSYLSSIDAFRRHLTNNRFTSEELASLGHQALEKTWALENDGVALITTRIIKLLKNREEYEKALALYSEYIQKLPRRNSLYIGRSIVHFNLGKFRKADQDCETIISREPQNMIALLRRVEITQGWVTQTSSDQEIQDIIQVIPDCMDKMSNAPAATSMKFLCGYIRALAIGAELCSDSNYANTAKNLLLTRNEIELEKDNRTRRSALKALEMLERFYEKVGKEDRMNELKTLRTKYEDKWIR